MVATIFLDSLLQFNYETPSDTFKIYIDTSRGDKIAQIESGVTFTPKPGSIDVSCVASDPVI